MSSLDDIARRFRQKQLIQTGAPVEGTEPDVDLDTLIAQRMNKAFDGPPDGDNSTANNKPREQAVDAPFRSNRLDSVATEEAQPDRASEPMTSADEGLEPDHHAAVEEPPAPSAAVSNDPMVTWIVPSPAPRTPGPKRRIVVEVSDRFDGLQHQAKQQGMSRANLLLSALMVHRVEVAEKARAGEYRHLEPRGPVRAWQLQLHPVEIEEFDSFVDEVADHFERRSRAAVTAALLESCKRP